MLFSRTGFTDALRERADRESVLLISITGGRLGLAA